MTITGNIHGKNMKVEKINDTTLEITLNGLKLDNPADESKLKNMIGKKCTVSLNPTEKYYTIKDIPEPKLHKQSRGYLKTAGSIVGKDMNEERSLFTLPSYDYDIRAIRDTISQKGAILGSLLYYLWQTQKQPDTDGRELYTITNLTEIANTIGTTPQQLKLYLIYLGGYQYPIIKAGVNKQGKRIISFSSDKLFYIKFNMRLKNGETEATFTKDDRIGNNYVNFIRDRDIDTIEIRPSESVIEELQGRGLGNVLVDDAFVAFCLDLSELAYKIFCLSGSNRPSWKISFDKLISKKHLNLEKQVYGVKDATGKRKSAGQGKTRELKRIQEALKELLDKGHLVKWAYNEGRDLFSWTYSSKIIKHKELLPAPIKIKTGQTRQDGTGSQLYTQNDKLYTQNDKLYTQNDKG